MNSGQGKRQQMDELAFRRPMAVTEALRFRTGGTYPVCPRCGVTMEREYQNFCDRCGQRLGWRKLHHAEVIIRR